MGRSIWRVMEKQLETAVTPGTVIDLVCGMTVNPATTPHHADYHGVAYHFYDRDCTLKRRFVGIKVAPHQAWLTQGGFRV